MPIPGSDFLYGFYADMEIENIDQFKDVVKCYETFNGYI